MAVRKGTKTKTPKKKTSPSAQRGKKAPGKPFGSWVILFWIAFVIFIFGLFLINRETIGKSIQTIQSQLAAGKTSETQEKPTEISETPPQTVRETKPAAEPVKPSNQTPVTVSPSPAERKPDAVQNTQTEQSSSAQRTQAAQSAEPARSPELRERVLYFIQVDRSGYIVRVQANRKLPASESPLKDVIQAIVAGPNEDERKKGFISLVPPETKLLSVAVRGNTAYISFSEDFQYNTYGVEGYAGQLRQIVFTATEFPNVNDVQILIEGRRIDYLGEGIWIGSPVSREML